MHFTGISENASEMHKWVRRWNWFCTILLNYTYFETTQIAHKGWNPVGLTIVKESKEGSIWLPKIAKYLLGGWRFLVHQDPPLSFHWLTKTPHEWFIYTAYITLRKLPVSTQWSKLFTKVSQPLKRREKSLITQNLPLLMRSSPIHQM